MMRAMLSRFGCYRPGLATVGVLAVGLLVAALAGCRDDAGQLAAARTAAEEYAAFNEIQLHNTQYAVEFFDEAGQPIPGVDMTTTEKHQRTARIRITLRSGQSMTHEVIEPGNLPLLLGE